MRRALALVVPPLTGCVLLVSLVSAGIGIYGPRAVPAADGPPPVTAGGQPLPPSRMQIGIASWYGRTFQGHLTASGEIYDMYQPTAAHRTAPLGIQAMVTNLANGHAVRVRINDRGPHKRRRLLDLSYEAARQLDMVRAGIARVQVEFLEAVPRLTQRPVMSIATWRDPWRATPAGQTRTGPPGVGQADASQEPRYALRVYAT